MTTFKQLTDDFERKVKQLQKSCKHTKLSQWYIQGDFHYNDTGARKKHCRVCNKTILHRYFMNKCQACGHRQWMYLPECEECKVMINHNLVYVEENMLTKKVIEIEREKS